MAKTIEVMSDLSKKKTITLYKAYVYDMRVNDNIGELPINTALTRVATTELGAIRHAFIEMINQPDYLETALAIANGKYDHLAIVGVTIDIPSSDRPIVYSDTSGQLDCNFNEAEGWLNISLTDKEFKLGCTNYGVSKLDCDIDPNTNQVYVRDIELHGLEGDFDDEEDETEEDDEIVDDE